MKGGLGGSPFLAFNTGLNLYIQLNARLGRNFDGNAHLFNRRDLFGRAVRKSFGEIDFHRGYLRVMSTKIDF